MKEHILYKTGDKDVLETLLDRNNEVVLDCCKVCGRGEADLKNNCTSRQCDS